jgi:hypothetical protein
MGFEVKIVEALAPQTSPLNPIEVPAEVCEHLFRVPLRGLFGRRSMEGTGATVRVKYPSTMGRRLWPAGTDTIDSLQW